MKTNVGGIDRMARIVVGALLILLTLMGTIGVWGWIGVVLLGPACSRPARPIPSWASTPARWTARPEV
jgi:hypothetical protein